ncbi:MAG: PAS domain S-box protein [Anaerolineaceae bacterium]|nr:PAS domain S-box protein [Anaerolineaceae bacterium]
MLEALQTKSNYQRNQKRLSPAIIIVVSVLLTLAILLLIWSNEVASALNLIELDQTEASSFWLSSFMRTIYTLALVVPSTVFAINTRASINEAHSFFEKLFFDSREPILLYRLDGKIISCNQAMESLLGFSTDTLKNKSLQDLLYTNGEDLPAIYRHSESSADIEHIFAVKNMTGEVIMVEAHQQHIKIKGKSFILSFLQDITLRHRESHKREMLNKVTTALLQVDSHQQIYDTVFEEILECCLSTVLMLVEVDLAYHTLTIIKHEGSLLALGEMVSNLTKFIDAESHTMDLTNDQIRWLAQEQLHSIADEKLEFPDALFATAEFIPFETYARKIFAADNRIISLILFDFKGGFDYKFTDSILNFFSIAMIRLHTEQQLYQNQIHLSETQHLVKAGRLQYDFTTKKSLFSEELCAIFGIEDQEQATDFHMIRSIYAEDRLEFAELLDSIIQNPTDEEIGFNFRITHPDGRLHYMRSQSKIFFDVNNQPMYMLTAIHDATDLVETRKQLYESQTRYKMTVENSPSLIMIVDLDMKIIYNNWSIDEENTPNPLLGCNLFSFVGITTHDRAVEAIIQTITEKDIVNIELPVRKSLDSEEQWMQINIIPVMLNDNVQELIFNMLDISSQIQMEASLRRSQHNFELIFEESPAMIAITSQADGSILQINKSFSKLFGISRQQARGKTSAEIGLWKSTKERLQYTKPDDENSVSRRQELALERPDGTVHLSIIVHPIVMKCEFCNIVILWDMSAQKAIESQLEKEREELIYQVADQMDKLRDANQELSQAMLAKDQFLVNMSHELKTPLTVILGISEVLYAQTSQPLTKKHLKFVKMIENSGRELLHLINDILDLSRIGQLEEDLRFEKIILSDLCRSSLMFVQQAANRKNIQLQYNIAPNINYVMADPIRFKQILTKLLDNGIKFTPEHGLVGLNVSLDESGTWIHFCVWDTGIGFTDEELEKTFAPFAQISHIDTTISSDNPSGAKLGLALVHQLTKLHGGRIQINSKPNEDTQVIVSLPIHQNTSTRLLDIGTSNDAVDHP